VAGFGRSGDIMKRLLAVVALVFVSSAAQAQYKFEYDGKTIRIDPDRGTVSIPGVYDNTGQKSKRARRDSDAARKQPLQQPAAPAQAAPATGAAPSSQPPDTVPPAPVANGALTAATPAPASQPAAVPPVSQTIPAAAASPPMAPAPAAAAPPVQRPAQAPTATAAINPAPAAAAPPARDPNSPIGIWLTEEKEGKIRIEACGANLCGYSIDAKTDQNREQILINMRPGQGKWSGRIFDPNTGSTYDSTIAMKGADSLQVQGCAFGGMFCGGQTWSRVN